MGYTFRNYPSYHFMAVFGLDGHAAIFGVAGLTMVTTQHACVCTCDAEETWGSVCVCVCVCMCARLCVCVYIIYADCACWTTVLLPHTQAVFTCACYYIRRIHYYEQVQQSTCITYNIKCKSSLVPRPHRQKKEGGQVSTVHARVRLYGTGSVNVSVNNLSQFLQYTTT